MRVCVCVSVCIVCANLQESHDFFLHGWLVGVN